MSVRFDELLKTREMILERPEIMDHDEVGKCVIGLTLSRVLNREVTIKDKHNIPALANEHLGLSSAQFDGLYRLPGWPEDILTRWREIPARRDRTQHPAGHIETDEEELRERAAIAADLITVFVAREGYQP